MVDSRLFHSTIRPRFEVDEDFWECVTEVAPEIFNFPFLSERFVEFLCHVSDLHGDWRAECGDDFGAPELRLRKITPNLEKLLSQILYLHVNPILRVLYQGCYEIGWISPPFIINYNMATQREMGLHYDGLSEVTLSVPLLGEASGGCLEFPRQDYCTEEVPLGSVLVFPGGPTHVHRARPIVRGQRKSLTIWTRSEEP